MITSKSFCFIYVTLVSCLNRVKKSTSIVQILLFPVSWAQFPGKLQYTSDEASNQISTHFQLHWTFLIKR